MLHIKELENGNKKITADSGKIIDTRNGNIYSEVVISAQQEMTFEEVLEEEKE